MAPPPAGSMVSFIVPAYNEEQLLGACLTAIDTAARSLARPFEVIVADDASSDHTAAIARAHGARVVPVSHRQIARTRNAGAAATAGELLIFVDADTLITPEVVQGAVQAMDDGAVGGGAEVRFEGRLPGYARLLLPLFVVYFRWFRVAAGCFIFCRRRAFETAGGFDERLFGAEEIALSRALKRQGRFVVLRHPVTTSGRKLRAHSGWEHLRLLGRLLRRGRGFTRSREAMDWWYHGRREDPDRPGP